MVFFSLLARKDIIILCESETYETKIDQKNNVTDNIPVIFFHYLVGKKSSDTPILCK